MKRVLSRPKSNRVASELITYQNVQPSWLSNERSRFIASWSTSITFLVSVSLVVAVSSFTLASAPLSDDAFQDLDQQAEDEVRCLRLARRADYVAVFVPLGSPAQYLQLLLRMDETKLPGQINVDVFSERMLKSLTMVCSQAEALHSPIPEATCRDVAFVYNGTYQQFPVHTDFTFSNDYIKASRGDYAHQLGLDGEMFMIRGYTYWITTTHYCWKELETADEIADDSVNDFAEEIADDSVNDFTDDSVNDFADDSVNDFAEETADDFADDVLFFENIAVSSDEEEGSGSQSAKKLHASIRNLANFGPLASSPAVNSTSNECKTNDHFNDLSVSLFPVAASLETAAWLVLETRFLYEYGNEILNNRRLVVEVGERCAEKLVNYTQVNNLYRLDCAHNPRYECQTSPSVPFRRLAEYRLRIDVDHDGSGEIRAVKTKSLSRIPQLASFTEGLNSALGRLFVMILTAAVVFVRGNQNSSDSKFMIEHVLDTIHCKQKMTTKVLEHTKYEVATDAFITLSALSARVLVFAYAWGPLLAGEHELVLLYEIIGILSSLLHFLLRYTALEIRLEYETPLTKLAGPMSICDVSVAVLLAFSEPPLLSTHDGRFAAVGRLLIGILMCISVFSRCFFASSICALLASTVRNDPNYDSKDPETGKNNGNQWYQSVLVLSTVLWIAQAVSTSGTFSALFVHPAGYSLTRILVGDVGALRFCLLIGMIATGLPTINKVGLRSLEHVCNNAKRDEHAH